MVNTDKCWLWAGSTNQWGYAKRKWGDKSYTIHRVMYENLVGEIPVNMQLDHLCKVRHCINPDHLEPVTPAENNKRSDSMSSLNMKKTHCLNGHEFNSQNTSLQKEISYIRRRCLICHRVYNRKSYAKRVAARST